jgi:hypothetical protein
MGCGRAAMNDGLVDNRREKTSVRAPAIAALTLGDIQTNLIQ